MPLPRWTIVATAALLALAAQLIGCGPRAESTGNVAGADIERGRRLIEQYQCGRCHAIPGVAGAQGRVASSLESMAVRSYIAGDIPNRPDTMQRWIVDPAALVPGTTMPALGVSPEEARHMAGYLGTLR